VSHSERGHSLALRSAETNVKVLPLTHTGRCTQRDGRRNLAATSAEAESELTIRCRNWGAIAEISDCVPCVARMAPKAQLLVA
jgi:hypothetical protein